MLNAPGRGTFYSVAEHSHQYPEEFVNLQGSIDCIDRLVSSHYRKSSSWGLVFTKKPLRIIMEMLSTNSKELGKRMVVPLAHQSGPVDGLCPKR